MDQVYLLALVAAIVIAMLALARIMTKPRAPASQGAGESPIGISTEGMKICQACGMGNFWAERRCGACRATLRG